MAKIYDVVIVGGGASGSLLANLLVKGGKSALVIESHKEMRRKVCGEYLCPLGVQLMKDLNLSSVIDDFLEVNGMRIFTPSGKEVRTHFPDSGKMVTYGRSVNRKTLDDRLILLATDYGAEYVKGSAVKSVQYKGDHWEVTTLNEGCYLGRLLVGADGRRSLVAKEIGATDFKVKDRKVALLCWIKREQKNNRFGQMHLFGDGSYIGVDPTGEYEQNVSLVCDPSLIKEHGGALGTINFYIKKSKHLNKVIGYIKEGEELHSVTPLMHKVKKYKTKNVALIGDAAGFLDPLTGEGIFGAFWMANALSEEINSENDGKDYTKAVHRYNKKKKFFFQKKILNIFFQRLMKHPLLSEAIARYLLKSKRKSDTFVGIIGNIYKPINGIIKILLYK